MNKPAVRPRVSTGTLAVPADLKAFDLAGMEARHHVALWPLVREGYRRYTRQFVWLHDGRTLQFRITDLPVRALI